MKEKSDIFSIFGFGFAEMNKKSLPSTLSYDLLSSPPAQNQYQALSRVNPSTVLAGS
ncbi:hypothetical protein [Siphonobacter curvatus]|uniref:hypothetical protein n=1 Tax=Siphonobacter curvatus TaxID=2094562 RepID=UPI0013FE1F08|nr:hypothetical protein [Siphonobacter curvatus]